MESNIKNNSWRNELLACPQCQNMLCEEEQKLICSSCQKEYLFEQLESAGKIANFIKKVVNE